MALHTVGNADIKFRYGEDFDVDDRHPLLRTISIPSPTLHNRRLEILLKSLNGARSQPDPQELLVPILDIPTSTSGRVSNVTFPVYKAIVYGDGVQDLLAVAPMGLMREEETKPLLRGVFNVVWQDSSPETAESDLSLVNLDQGESAIQSFRESLENSFRYEHGWLGSNLQEVQDFLLQEQIGSAETVRPALKSLINNMLARAEKSIAEEKNQGDELQKSKSPSIATRQRMETSLSTWTENAHLELRDKLELAFSSRSWRKLAWWKLLWRVDDVEMITGDILQRAYLVDAEKGIIWVGGQVDLLGFGPSNILSQRIPLDLGEGTSSIKPLRVKDIMTRVPPTETFDFRFDPATPWPQEIAASRSALLVQTLPSLQALAQSLVFQGLTTTGLMSALSALVYISVSTTTVYEAGIVAAVGLVWSARRMQTKWETAKSVWKDAIRAEGKRALNAIETNYKELIREGAKPKMNTAALEEQAKISEAIAATKQALQVLSTPGRNQH
jgi:hypothetical protein